MDVVTGFTEAEIKGITLEREGDWLRVIPGSPVEERFVLNGATFLARMAGTGYVPQSKLADAGLLIEDLGESEKVWDEIAFRRNCARLLLKLQELNIAHGDLTSKNIIVKDNCPIVVDWWQAKATDDPTPKKRPESDAFHLWTAAAELSPDTSRPPMAISVCSPPRNGKIQTFPLWALTKTPRRLFECLICARGWGSISGSATL
jgi:hypothetical protein